MINTRFRLQRWQRAGATAKQLEELEAAHTAMTLDERATEGARIDGISDSDLHAELTGPDLSGNVDEVLAKVGDDRELAAVALSLEQAKAKPRGTLVDALNVVIEGDTDTDA